MIAFNPHSTPLFVVIYYLVPEQKATYFLVSPPFVKGDLGGFNGISICKTKGD